MRWEAEMAVRRAPGCIASLGIAALLVMLVYLVGRPVGTDDVWWHLALGERYAEQGVHLEADPLLFTAEQPPAPAAWLFDVTLHGLERSVGFQGLRVFHVGLVLGILALAYGLFRRESGSHSAACLALAALIGVAWYRFIQLRAALFTILAVLWLYALLSKDERPSWGRVAAAAALIGVWANVHAAFLLGPLLLFAALLGTGLREALIRWGRARPASDLSGLTSNASLAGRLAAVLLLGLAATLLNPQGIGQHLAFVNPVPSPDLSHVSDDWMPFNPFMFGDVRTRLGPLVWCITDALLILVPLLAVVAGLRFLREPTRRNLHAADPVLFGLAAASCVAILAAIRFQWLLVFPLLFVMRAGRAWWSQAQLRGPWLRLAPALGCAALVPAFAFCSSSAPGGFGAPNRVSDYVKLSFSTGKYYSHSVWFLRDAALEGRLWNDYFMGGYLGYWLTPKLRCFVNGTLNFPPDVGVDFWAIREQRGVRPGESYLDVLDRRGVDLAIGVGLPVARDPRLAPLYTTGLLEGAVGWIPVFRDVRSAVYLRLDAANRANLERVAQYYAGQGVPFDRTRGFDPLAALRAEPAWAMQHGIAPSDYGDILRAERSRNRPLRTRALGRLAGLYSALGSYAEAVRLDEQLLRLQPRAVGALRRLVYGSLLVDRPDAALRYAQRLRKLAPADGRSRSFVAMAEHYNAPGASLAEPVRLASGVLEAPDAAIHRLPLLSRGEAARLLAGIERPPVRRR
jgi:tetratricopeptide (TPR) repeat protein